MNTNNAVLIYANGYRFNFNWSIIPIDPATKRPLLEWKRFQSRLPDEQELKLWFENKTRDQVGIALVTGKLSGVAVLDIDDHTGQTFGYTSNLMARSGGGGTHLLYQWHEGIENRARISGDPLDVRGEGGYIILPPSMHPSGNSYHWLTDLNQVGNAVKSLGRFPVIPEIKVQEKKYEMVNVKEGNRNDNLYRLACSLDKKKPSDVLFAMKTVNKSFDPPLDDKELLVIYNQAMKHNVYVAPAKPREVSSLVTELLDRREKEKQSVGTGYPSLNDIIKGFLPGHLYALTGETNMGKTTLAVNFAYNLTRMGEKVLYIALEPDIQILTSITSLMTGKKYNDLTNQDFTNLPDIKVLLQEDCRSFSDLAKIVEENNDFNLIIVDHIGYFVVEGDWVQGQSTLIKQLALLAKKKQQAILYIVHPHKRNDSDTIVRMNDISGTASHKQDCTEVMSLERKEFKDDFGSIQVSLDAKLHVLKSKVSATTDRKSIDLFFTQNCAVVTENNPTFNMVSSIFPGAKYVP